MANLWQDLRFALRILRLIQVRQPDDLRRPRGMGRSRHHRVASLFPPRAGTGVALPTNRDSQPKLSHADRLERFLDRSGCAGTRKVGFPRGRFVSAF